MTNENREYFSMADMAARYNVEKSTVSRWIDEGFFPGAEKKGPYKNSPYRIPASAVEHFDKLRESGLPS